MSKKPFVTKEQIEEIVKKLESGSVPLDNAIEEFKKAMYGKAIEFMREMEEAGDLKPGTANKIAENSRLKGEL